MIDKLGERYLADAQSHALLTCFEQKASEPPRCEAAVRYFWHVPDRPAVRAVSTRLGFHWGAGHEANRQLAFVSFLLLDEVADYFDLHDEQELAAGPNPDFRVDLDYPHEAVLLPVLAMHFERLYASLTGDLTRIMHRHFGRGLESAWAALARCAPPASPLLSHLRHYAATHAATLSDPKMLAQLTDLMPDSDPVKQLAWQWVLGRQFAIHPDVQAFVADIREPSREIGKILVGCAGVA